MTITGLEAIPVRMDVAPLEEELGLAPYVSNHDQVSSVDRVLVRLETDEGIVGWGEMLVALKSASVTKTVIEDVIAPELIGESVEDAHAVLENFYYPYVRINPFIGAVDTAVWDALGKKNGAPISELLGGSVTEEVDVAFCLGILPPEKSAVHAQQAADAGFTTLKTKAGPDWSVDIERLSAMHDAVDGELDFRLDPNQGWTMTEAVRALTRLEKREILLEYIEQPLRTETFGSYASLRSRTRTPIGVNEDTYFNGNLRQLLKANAIDAAVIDLVPAGGLSAARGQAAEAKAAGVSVSHHCGFDLGVKTAAMLHLVGSTAAIDLVPDSVYYGWDDYVIEDPFEIRDGAYPVPTDPGLGIAVDESKVEQYRLEA